MSRPSDSLKWMLMRDHTSFLVKNNGVTFSHEPGNLRNKHSFKYSTLANSKSIGVVENTDKKRKGAILITKTKHVRKASRIAKVPLTRGVRRGVVAIKGATKNYRPDLKADARARLSQIVLSQKRKVSKKAPHPRHAKKQQQQKTH